MAVPRPGPTDRGQEGVFVTQKEGVRPDAIPMWVRASSLDKLGAESEAIPFYRELTDDRGFGARPLSCSGRCAASQPVKCRSRLGAPPGELTRP
jgi:hypothetical protein